MLQSLTCFWLEEDGQDLIEYSLLITFIAIATMWIIGIDGPAVSHIWGQANTTITNAAVVAGGG